MRNTNKKKTMINNYDKLEKKLGITFKNKDILENAFIHRSYINENRSKHLENNERLEFLGDAVLELITSDYLYKKYPDKQEGELTAIRSALVRTESLAEESKRLGFGEYFLMSKGERDSGGKQKEYLLADLFEAILGAIYLDNGLQACITFVSEAIFPKADNIVSKGLFVDPKTKVQELLQSKCKVTPTYILIKEDGPDHNKYFTVALQVGDKQISEGTGSSKQKAEESAAQNAIELIEDNNLSLI